MMKSEKNDLTRQRLITVTVLNNNERIIMIYIQSFFVAFI